MGAIYPSVRVKATYPVSKAKIIRKNNKEGKTDGAYMYSLYTHVDFKWRK